MTTATMQATPQSAATRKARGAHIEETALMLALASTPAPAVQTFSDEAVSDWETNAPRRESAMLAAEDSGAANSDAEKIAAAVFVWLSIRGAFRLGKRVYKTQEVFLSLDSYLETKRASFADELFQSLRAGKYSLKEAQLLGERELLKTHLASAMLAKGGSVQMASADYARVGELVKPELGFWRDRFSKLADGDALDGRVLQSFRAFFSAPAATFQVFDGLEMEKRGYDEWKNRLNDNLHHCEPSGGRPSCRQLSVRFVPRAKRVLRGARACFWQCRCSDIWKNSQTGEVRN